MVNLGNDWDTLLKGEFEKEYYLNLRNFLKKEYSEKTVYPPMEDIFNSLKTTAMEETKCIILGQDPYHGAGQAHGFAFSVQKGVPLPPSLKNIFRELYEEDARFREWSRNKVVAKETIHGDLTKWARQGVLLLNTCLTVREGEAGSHRNRGWEILTDKIIQILGRREKPCVFILWGNPARAKKSLIGKQHLVLEGAHPSPLSAYRGFFGGGYFVRCNEFLKLNGQEPVDWTLDGGFVEEVG